MSLARRFLAMKSRPLPLVAFAAFGVELLAFLPLVGGMKSPLTDDGTWSGPAIPFVLHLIGSALAGAAFPGWWGARGGSWGVRAGDESPARALVDTPPVDFTVAEMGRGAQDARQQRGATASEERRPTHRLGPMMMGTALCFPVLGALAATIVALVRRVRSERYEDVIRHYRELVDASFPVLDLPPDVRDSVVERTWAALELRPFVEIIGAQTGEDEVAVSAIESTSALDYPVASRLLRHALASAIPETRYYAAKALARIEESLDRELQEAQEAHRRRPTDPVPMMRIADARLSYGEVGQTDDPLNRFHLTEAIKFYKACLPAIAADEKNECIARLAAACLKVGQSDEAQRHYCELVDRGSQQVSVLRGCIEACFANGDYEKVRHYARVAALRVPDSDLIREVGRTWLEPQPSR